MFLAAYPAQSPHPLPLSQRERGDFRDKLYAAVPSCSSCNAVESTGALH